MIARKNTSELLDAAAEKALSWAIDTLDRRLPERGQEGYDAKAWDKDQQRKAQAASIVAAIKARTDPAAMRGRKQDRVGEILSQVKRVSRANGRRLAG